MAYYTFPTRLREMHDGPSHIARPTISWVDLSNDEVL